MQFSTLVFICMLGVSHSHASLQYLRTFDEDQPGQFLSSKSSAQGHPEGADYESETPVASGMSLSVELLVAGSWITMVCVMPIVAAQSDGKLTKTQICIAGAMLFAFLGGIWLFTNIIYFKSVHFDGIRSLTIVECVYLMSQILTTVGYGDIVPAKPRAQVFVALYVVFSVLLIANCVTEITPYVKESMVKAQIQVEKVANSGLKKMLSEQRFQALTSKNDNQDLDEEAEALAEFLAHKSPPLPWEELTRKFLGWAFFVAAGVLFYSNYPGENKNLWQSFYFSIITLSTVGFGAFTALTSGGKVYGAFWMLFGSLSLVGLVGAFTKMIYALKAREKWRQQKSNAQEDVLYKNLPDRIDAATFLKFAVEYTSLVTTEELDVIQGTFEELVEPGKEAVPREQALRLLTQTN